MISKPSGIISCTTSFHFYYSTISLIHFLLTFFYFVFKLIDHTKKILFFSYFRDYFGFYLFSWEFAFFIFFILFALFHFSELSICFCNRYVTRRNPEFNLIHTRWNSFTHVDKLCGKTYYMRFLEHQTKMVHVNSEIKLQLVGWNENIVFNGFKVLLENNSATFQSKFRCYACNIQCFNDLLWNIPQKCWNWKVGGWKVEVEWNRLNLFHDFHGKILKQHRQVQTDRTTNIFCLNCTTAGSSTR